MLYQKCDTIGQGGKAWAPGSKAAVALPWPTKKTEEQKEDKLGMFAYKYWVMFLNALFVPVYKLTN